MAGAAGSMGGQGMAQSGGVIKKAAYKRKKPNKKADNQALGTAVKQWISKRKQR